MPRLAGAQPAGTAALDDALRCLDEQAGLEVGRDSMLQTAGSLGRRIEAERAAGRGAPGDLLRRAERLQQDAMDLELELLGKRQACRDAAQRALPGCEARIRALEAALHEGRGSEAEARELLLLREARGRLQAGLAGPAMLGYPLLPPDSTDTQETLRAKLQYHEEVQGRLRSLAERVGTRACQVREERRTLAEARRFLEDLSFLDEGGRVTPGGTAQFRGGPGGGVGLPDGNAARPTGAAEVAGSAADLERILGWTPATPEESDRLLRMLEQIGAVIDGESRAVAGMLEQIRGRIRPETPPR